MLAFNFGSWEFWEEFNPSGATFGQQKVTFDGINKLILVNNHVDELDVREDIYSNWKEWLMVGTNSKFAEAITTTGGDQITTLTYVGITYFLENGWRIKPYGRDHILTIDGNLYTREPNEDPYVVPDGEFKVTVNTLRSNLTDIVRIPDGLLNTDKLKIDELHKLAGLQPDNPLIVSNDSRTAGATIVQDISAGDSPVVVQRI